MKSRLIIKDGLIIDPARSLEVKGDLVVEDGKIIQSGPGAASSFNQNAEVIEAKGMIIAPGFIDFHCHLREPGFEDKETIKTGSLAAAAGGFTTICCMPNTQPSADSTSTLSYIRETAARDSRVRVLPIACVTVDRAGKTLAPMIELAEAGAVGFSDDGSPIADSWIMLRALEYSKPLGLPIINHCEDPALVANGQMNEGKISTLLGIPSSPAISEEVMIARDVRLAEYTGAWVHIAHISTAGGVEIVREAKRRGVRVTAEATPHHLSLTEEAVMNYDTNARVNPPLRTQEDIEALIEGLKDGTIDIIATDHAPHTSSDKNQEFSLAPAGISGFETALGVVMKLVHDGRLTMAEVVSKMTIAPAAILVGAGLKLGSLDNGSIADITIIDPGQRWVVDSNAFLSKGKNTPYNRMELKGKVAFTIVSGQIIFNGTKNSQTL
ncbi:MAG: dihydroorotase [Dehalococcoidales bacterium]|nr:dihydroorotase [Dehalococcoidales bacterium]